MRLADWFAGLALLGIATGVSAFAPSSQADSVIKIETAGGHGSGVHIGHGHVLTAAHVVPSAYKAVDVKTPAGRSTKADVLWINTTYDIALLKLRSTIGLGASELTCRELVKGEAISALGNPGSMDFLTHHGTVSGSGREVPMWKWVVPTDITLLPGMSGGPVLDEGGDLVGITVGTLTTHVDRYASWAAVGIVVPSSTICDLMART